MNYNELTKKFEIEIPKNTISFTEKTRKWCCLKYKNNKNGCPNFNYSEYCPPFSEYKINILEDFTYFYLLYVKFNFKFYKLLRNQQHPNWTKDQLENLLWWQPSVIIILRTHIMNVLTNNINLIKNGNIYLLASGSGKYYQNMGLGQQKVYSMESGGIYVFGTLKNNNIPFELKPENYVLLVSLLCSTKKLNLNIKRKSVLGNKNKK